MKTVSLQTLRFYLLTLSAVLCLVGSAQAQEQELFLGDGHDEVLAADVNIVPLDPNAEIMREPEPVYHLQRVKTLTGDPEIEVMLHRIISKDVKVSLQGINSLFFTQWESNLLSDARNGFVAKPPKDTEINPVGGGIPGGVNLPRGPREISIGGIVYRSADNWTVWLNGQQIKPNALPDEITGIEVSKEYVKLKWFDAYSNQVFPIKLRTHQRFNIDTRIFLPG